MDLAGKKAMVTALCGNDTALTSALCETLLSKAEHAILRRLYPIKFPDGSEVPTEYEMLQCELATRYFFRMGGEGEIRHSENGIYRTYKDTTDEDLLSEVVQVLYL